MILAFWLIPAVWIIATLAFRAALKRPRVGCLSLLSIYLLSIGFLVTTYGPLAFVTSERVASVVFNVTAMAVVLITPLLVAYVHIRTGILGGAQTAMSKRWSRNLMLAVLGWVLFQTACWFTSARDNLYSEAWVAWATNVVERNPDIDKFTLFIEPSLFLSTPVEEINVLRERLEQLGIRLLPSPFVECHRRQAPCAWISVHGWGDVRGPLFATPSIAWFQGDYNADLVFMLQVGPRWMYIYSWQVAF